MAIGAIFGVIGSLVGLSYFLPPLQNVISRELNTLFPENLNIPLTISDLRMRKEITRDDYFARMREHGYDEEKAENFFKVRQSLYSAGNLITLKFREQIDDKFFKTEMSKLGYSDEQTDNILQSNYFYPYPADIFRFLDTGALLPETREKYPWAYEVPSNGLDWGKKAGIPDKVLELYYAAHWAQPRYFRLRDMLHREVIDKDEIKLAFKFQGYSDYWQDKLVEVMTLPPTRVDIRRMHKLGIIDKEKVKEYYRWRHYPNEVVENLTNWTVEYNKQSTETQVDTYRDLSRTVIERAYQKKILKRDTAKERLQDLDYSEKDADLLLDMRDLEDQEDERDNLVDYLQEAVLRGKITVDEAQVALTQANVESSQMDYLIEKWQRRMERKVETPTKEDLMTFYTKGIIKKEQVKQELTNLGYSDKHVSWYMELLE